MDDRSPVNLRCSALVLRDDTVLLCRRTAEEDTWILPGGTPHTGEGSAATACREVAEETGLQIAVERVAFVLETTSWDTDHHLIEIIFVGVDRDSHSEPTQFEEGLDSSFVPLNDLDQIGLRPPIAGYIRGFARARGRGVDPTRATASYLGNVWRPSEDVDPGVAPTAPLFQRAWRDSNPQPSDP